MKRYKSVEILSNFRMSSHRTNAKAPVENFLATVLRLLLIHFLSTRSTILAKWNKSILTCAVAWPAQNFRWVKMVDFRRATVYVS